MRVRLALAVILVLAFFLLPATLLAQRRGFPDVGGRRVGGGFGHHGFGHGTRVGVGVGIGIGVRTGHMRLGVGLGFDSFHHRAVRPRFIRPGFVSYGYPAVYPYYAAPVYAPVVPYFGGTTVVVVPGYGSYTNNTYYVDPPAQTVRATQVPSETTYTSASPVQSAPRLILLAFQDHSIYAVTDYWVDGDTLYYTTSYGARSQAQLSSLDLSLTVQLNRERGVNFSLDSRTVR